jgi:type II secretory pathway component GspD/PulD (secretin)
MKLLLALILTLSTNVFASDKKIDFKLVNMDAIDAIKLYAKESGQKFMWDASVSGKINIDPQGKISLDEAREMLVHGLAARGFGIIVEGETNHVLPVRDLQRSAIPVFKDQLPKDTKEIFATYIYTIKNDVDAGKVATHLISKDGSIDITKNNKLVMTDWLSNLKKIDTILAEVDTTKK